MIDDYKYMYLYKPLYMDVYIKDCIDIWDFFFGWGWLGIRILVLGWDALILPLIRNLYKPLPFRIGMLLWFEAMMIAFSFDTLIDFLCFIGYYLVVGISSFSTQILSMVVLWNLPSVFRIMAIW